MREFDLGRAAVHLIPFDTLRYLCLIFLQIANFVFGISASFTFKGFIVFSFFLLLETCLNFQFTFQAPDPRGQ